MSSTGFSYPGFVSRFPNNYKFSFLIAIIFLLNIAGYAAPCTLNTADPSVTICTPANGATVNSPVHIVAGTTDSHAVSFMQIYVDGVKKYQVSGNTLDTSLAMSAGARRVTVQAQDSTGAIFKSTINITVSGSSGCTPSSVDPSVRICHPLNGATFTSPARVWAATNDSHSVTLMQIYLDFVKVYEVHASTLDTILPMAPGPHRLTVQAQDSIGQIFKSTINFTVEGDASVVAVSPASATLNFGQTQQFTADLSATWSVDGIVGGNATVGTITSAGLYTAPDIAGTHTITATSTADPARKGNATVTVDASSDGTKIGVFTYKYNNARTGANLKENILTTENVNGNTFGKKFSFTVDGNIYAQPLYVPDLTINGVKRNLLFVATEHNSVYAFDADGKTLSPLWKKSFINTANGVTTVSATAVGSTLVPEIGITGTPVIDAATQTMYLVVATKEGTTYKQRLHALSLTTGAEKFAGPITIQASVTGTGDGSVNGAVAFQPKIQLQRPALLLANGIVYIAWASHGDNGLYHGWVIGYDAQTLARVVVHNNTPNGRRGGIWQSGGGLAADSAGHIYYISGNGSFSASSKSYGDSFVKLDPNGAVADYFTPFDQANMNSTDLDLGVGGPLLLPDQPGAHPHLITGCGKDAKIYLIDRDNMGKFQSGSNSNAVQTIPKGSLDHCHMQPVYWNGNVYFAGENSPMRMFTLSNGKFNTTPTAQTNIVFGGGDNVGTNPVVSANGNSNAIVWSMQRTPEAHAVLHAFRASNLTPLYNSGNVAGSSDYLGPIHQKYTPPLVVNGKVYVSLKGKVSVFGLL